LNRGRFARIEVDQVIAVKWRLDIENPPRGSDDDVLGVLA
jgi:hypothetical protein